jgi:hypothetical protein
VIARIPFGFYGRQATSPCLAGFAFSADLELLEKE